MVYSSTLNVGTPVLRNLTSMQEKVVYSLTLNVGTPVLRNLTSVQEKVVYFTSWECNVSLETASFFILVINHQIVKSDISIFILLVIFSY